jgi:hypothetical protein
VALGPPSSVPSLAVSPGPQLVQQENARKAKAAACITKKGRNDKKALDKDKNYSGQCPQSCQEDDGQKADAESPWDFDCTPRQT